MAGLAVIHRDITDEDGNILDGAVVTIRKGHASGGDLANIYADAAGVTALSNPVTVNGAGNGSPSAGVLSVYAAPGAYRLEGTSSAGGGVSLIDAGARPTDSYDTRAAFVSDVADGFWDDASDGTIVYADGLAYKRSAGATALTGLPDWVPSGDAEWGHFGALGDCTAVGSGTDDTAAIQAALTWVSAAPYRWVKNSKGKRYRMSGTATADFGGFSAGGIIMKSPITPDAQAGDAIRIYDARGGTYDLWVEGGGADADYTQTDPTGGSQAFVVRGVRGGVFNFRGYNYKGRVLRMPEKATGETKTSKTIIRTFQTGDIVPTAGKECGQAWLIDTNASGFGSINSAWTFWDKYGWVFKDTGDISIGQIEGGARGSSGWKFQGCYSVWGGTLSNGDETNTLPLISFIDSATRSCYNIALDQVFVIGGTNGVVAKNVGTSNKQGIKIGKLVSRLCTATGLVLENCRGADISVDSKLDKTSVALTGTTSQSEIRIESSAAKGTALTVASTCGIDNQFSGSIKNGNRDNTADTPLMSIQTTAFTLMNGLTCESDKVNYIGDFASGNNIHWTGGRVGIAGGTGLFSNEPEVAVNVSGYRTRNAGTTIIPSGSNNVVISHGLHTTPLSVNVTGRQSEVKDVIINSPTSTTFTIVADAAVTANRIVYWEASTGAAYG